MKASQIVEAVLFASDAPLTADEIARADESLDEDRVETAIQELRTAYDEADRAFHLVALAGGFQILTRSEFSTYLERFDTVPRSPRLSGPALETLAIIAYRQPISRVEVEYIRGVSSSGVLRTLQDRGLIDVVGRAEGIGRPYLYGTTEEFLNHFGFRSMEELPRPEELPVILRENPPLDDEGDEAVGGEDSPGPEEGPDGSGTATPADEAPAEEEDDGPNLDEALDQVLEDLPPEAGDDGDGPPPRNDFEGPQEGGEGGDRPT